MATYTQAHRPISVKTPHLETDVLLLRGFNGHEFISQLFQFHLDLIAENEQEIAFENVLGQKVTVALDLPGNQRRHFSGICSRVAQGMRDATFTGYRMEVVPQVWFLTKRAQSRIFQQMTVPDILRKVFAGLDVAFDQIKGTFPPRDYCVQYRETDFNFASRLMEEEGIYYFFTHAADGHTMVLANTPQGHLPLPEQPDVIFEPVKGGPREELRITSWEKVQELRSGKYTLWDHCFELPHRHLDADKVILDRVKVGTIDHPLKVGHAEKLEIYDYPGAYAQRFDGLDRAGGGRAADLQKIFVDNKRTVEIRMQQEALPSLTIRGESNCGHFVTGHKFAMERHFNADGHYVLTGVEHSASLSGDYRSGQGGGLTYHNTFTCIPYALPFRPLQVTPKPVVQGTQTAVVVGPKGDEIFTDKYSRVKVQFHWDREGTHDAGSSCWVRVGTPWAGKHWGMIHIPRIGQEVIVDFLEGDPDNPIIVGSVYNADMMPPYDLPANKTQSGIQSRSSLGGTPANFNQIRFEDKKGAEQVHIHAEKNQDIEVENDETHWVGHDRTKTIDHDETTLVKHDRTETVGNNETITIGVNRTEKVGSNETITIGVNRTEKVGANETISIGANRTETVGSNESITVALTRTRMVGVAETVTIGAAQAITVGAARAVTVAAAQTITVGASQTITVGADQTITVAGGETESYGGDHGQTVGGGQTVKVAGDGGYNIGGGRTTDVTNDDGLKVGKKLSVNAGDEITLTTGDASITMKKDGTIQIKGKDILIQGSGEIVGKASKDMTLKGQKILQN